MKMHWVEELPGKPHQPRRGFYKPRESTRDLQEHAVELIRQPLRWAKYPRPLSRRMARSVACNIAEGALQAYNPDLGFETAVRGDELYVRHNPDIVSPIEVARREGYEAGVREALTKVRSGLYDFRVFMRRLEEESGYADPAA